MIYRPLGRTGLNVSAIGLGGAAFGNMYGDLSTEEIRRAVHAAIDAGINLIDTSPFYGLTTSETNLGMALTGVPRDRFFLCSKAGRNGDRDFDFSPAAMRRSVEASLKRLRTDHLDILLAHDIEFAPNAEDVFTETAGVLHDLKREGKTRLVGMSAYPLALLRTAIERCQLDVVISYCHHCLQNDRLLDELLPVGEAHGVGVLNASPLSMGLLTRPGPPAWHPASAEIRAACRAAADACAARGADIAFLGMQFCLAEPRVSSVISGAARAEELAVNLKAMNTSIDPDLLAEVSAILAPVHNRVWPSGPGN